MGECRWNLNEGRVSQSYTEFGSWFQSEIEWAKNENWCGFEWTTGCTSRCGFEFLRCRIGLLTSGALGNGRRPLTTWNRKHSFKLCLLVCIGFEYHMLQVGSHSRGSSFWWPSWERISALSQGIWWGQLGKGPRPRLLNYIDIILA